MNTRIKKIRKDFRLSQEAFGKKVFVTGNYILFIETGRRTPSKRLVFDICREYGVNEEWLRYGTGKPYVEGTKPYVPDKYSEQKTHVSNEFAPDDNVKDRIYQVRRDNKLTQEMLGERIGVCKGAVCAIEKGVRKPSRRVIYNICHEFGINEEWLFFGTGDCYTPLRYKFPADDNSLRKVIDGIMVTYYEMDKGSRDVIDAFFEKLLENLKKQDELLCERR